MDITKLWSFWAPTLLAALLLGGWHGLILGLNLIAVVPSLELIAPVVGVGLLIGSVTGLLGAPVAWGLRRFHKSWPAQEHARATWAAALAWAGLFVGWTLASRLFPEAKGLISLGVHLTASALLGWAAWRAPPLSERHIRRFGVGALFILFVLPPLLAWALTPPPQHTPEARTARAGAPDVVLVTIDTLRADRVGAYGGGVLTPELDRIAQEGVKADAALAAAPWTVPSVATVMTGQTSLEHRAGRVVDPAAHMLRTPLASEQTTLAERFRQAGYRTEAVVSNTFLAAEAGFSQGFDTFDNRLLTVAKAGAMHSLPLTQLLLRLVPVESVADYRASAMVDAGRAALSAPREQPLFLWLHLIDIHAPYQVDPTDVAWINPSEMEPVPTHAQPDGSLIGDAFGAVHSLRAGDLWLTQADRDRVQAYYDRSVSYVDQELGRLFADLRTRERPTVLLVTSDHGEEFWEHGGFEHGHAYWREVVDVPFLVWGSGVQPGEVPTAGHVDVAPTLLGLAGLPVPDDLSGRPLLDGSEADSRTLYAEGNLYDLPGVLVARGPWRYTLHANGRSRLFNIEADPEEQFDQSRAEPARAEVLHRLAEPRLREMLGLETEQAQLSPEHLEGLRALGYLE